MALSNLQRSSAPEQSAAAPRYPKIAALLDRVSVAVDALPETDHADAAAALGLLKTLLTYSDNPSAVEAALVGMEAAH